MKTTKERRVEKPAISFLLGVRSFLSWILRDKPFVRHAIYRSLFQTKQSRLIQRRLRNKNFQRMSFKTFHLGALDSKTRTTTSTRLPHRHTLSARKPASLSREKCDTVVILVRSLAKKRDLRFCNKDEIWQSVFSEILWKFITPTINHIFCQQCRLLSHSYCWKPRFCWSKNAKTATNFLTCFDTTTFNDFCFHAFTAKMTLVRVRSLLFYEEILYP